MRYPLLWIIVPIALGGRGALAGDTTTNPAEFRQQVVELCEAYWKGFGSRDTELCYHARLNGPKGLGALSSPNEIEQGLVNGKPMPWGYGSGIQDVPLENGQFLFALCDAYDATKDPRLAEMARRIFRGFRRIAALSPDQGFVPRGPHPDGKSYYRNSSRDQHAAFVEALWRWRRSRLATEDDRAFIEKKLEHVAARLEKNQWKIATERGDETAHVGFSWLGDTHVQAITLLSFLAQIADVSGDDRWRELYSKYLHERAGTRLKKLAPDRIGDCPPLTLYMNQFSQSLAAWERCEKDDNVRGQIVKFHRELARRMFATNVFDPRQWRRLDWAGDDPPEAIEPLLMPLGLSLDKPATVLDIYRAFDGSKWASMTAAQRRISGKLCFGLPTVACHTALLSGDGECITRSAPVVRNMAEQMLRYGDAYDVGENFNRAVILGLLLVAREPAN